MLSFDIKKKFEQYNFSFLNNYITFFILLFIAIFTHYFVLKYIFPGYFDPLYACHSDMYIPTDLHYNPALSIAILSQWERPISYIFLYIIGILETKNVILCFILLAIFNSTFTFFLIIKKLHIKVSFYLLIVSFIYFFLIFTNPNFYFSYRWDTSAYLSYFFIIIGITLFLRADEKKEYLDSFFYLFLFTTIALLTKETYFLVLCLLVFIWLLCKYKTHKIKAFIPILALIVALAIYLLLHPNSATFVSLKKETSAVYSISFKTMFVELLKYIQEASNIISYIYIFLCIILGTVFLIYKKRNYAIFIFTCLLCFILSIIPNSLLPNHHFGMYGIAGINFLYLPVLLIPLLVEKIKVNVKLNKYIIILMVFILTYNIILNQKVYNSESWSIEQEKTQKKIMNALEILMPKLSNEDSTKILILGLENTPFKPFHHPYCLAVYNKQFAEFYISEKNINSNIKSTPITTWINYDTTIKNNIKFDQIWIFDNNYKASVIHLEKKSNHYIFINDTFSYKQLPLYLKKHFNY